jgi:hypothetical protein
MMPKNKKSWGGGGEGENRGSGRGGFSWIIKVLVCIN